MDELDELIDFLSHKSPQVCMHAITFTAFNVTTIQLTCALIIYGPR